MKYSIILILIFFSQNQSFSITEYKPNDELFIWAKSGLNLREKPSSDSKVLTKIPFGKKVICQDWKNKYQYENHSVIINDKVKSDTGLVAIIEFKGKWAKVSFEGFEGYVFDAYLSRFHPIKVDRTNIAIIDYFKKIGTVLSHIKEENSSEEIRRAIMVFDNGIFLDIDNTEGPGVFFQAVIPNFSKEEAFLILRHYDNYTEDFTQTKDGFIEIRQEVGGYNIKYLGDVVVLSGGWGC